MVNNAKRGLNEYGLQGFSRRPSLFGLQITSQLISVNSVQTGLFLDLWEGGRRVNPLPQGLPLLSMIYTVFSDPR